MSSKKPSLFEEDQNTQTPVEVQDFAKLFEQSWSGTKHQFEKGAKAAVEVMTVGRDSIFVLAKGQEGYVDRAEYKELPKVGDTLNLFYVKTEGSMLVFTTKASNQAMAEDLEEAADLESAVPGTVTEAVNGGFRVMIQHKSAFCPISQMDLKVDKDPAYYVGKKFDFVITQFNHGKNIVVSRKKLLQQEQALAEGEFMEKIKPGDTCTGRVSRLEKFGAFVELGSGMEGLIHISELGWSRIEHPSEVVSVGDTVTTKIMTIGEDERGRMRIGLSRKQAEEDPWEKLSKELSVGQNVTGKVKSQERFGILIEIVPGVTGLLPKSNIRGTAWEREVEAKKSGDAIAVVIQSISPTDKRISLGLPDDPESIAWKDFSAKAPGAGKSFGNGLADQLSAFKPARKS